MPCTVQSRPKDADKGSRLRMLQESLGVGGDSASSVRKLVTHVQKLVQLASVTPNALTLREYRDALEECLKSEGSAAMKILGFQLAGIASSCSTLEVWKFILEACITEMGDSENTSVLAEAVHVLGLIPVSLVLGFLLSPEREPMNKLRAALTHEDTGVRCSAIETLSKLTVDVVINVAGDGLFIFPFESHEARICCQQDVETMVNDCWKLIFHTLFLDGQPQNADRVVGAAFTALANLFARSSPMTQFFPSTREAFRAQSSVDDVTSMVYKNAFPRIRALITAAQTLTMKQQPDAILWIAMVLHVMMERSGARCPSVSVPYVEIDVVDESNPDGADNDDGDEAQSSTEPVRVDGLVSDLLELWIIPAISQRVSLAQSTAMCRAIFILLAHPLQSFTRMRWAAQLANHIIAQCYLVNKNPGNNTAAQYELKFEFSDMLVKTFAWLSGVNCQTLFVRSTEALYLLDQERDRRDLVQKLMDTIIAHVVANRDFQLLQGLCTLAFFRQPKGFSRLSPRTNGSEVARSLFQALSATSAHSSPPHRGALERQVAQLIALRVFRGLLLLKLGGSAATSPKAYRRSCEISDNVVYYTGLLTTHYQGIFDSPELALRESLDFFQSELFPTMPQIASQCARLQILWIGVRLHRNYASHVPFESLLKELQHETGRLFTAIFNDDDEMEGATFDNGLLGCVDAGGEEVSGQRKRAGDANTVDALMVLGDCIAFLAQLQPYTKPQFLKMCEQMVAALTASGGPPATTSQQYRVIEEVIALLSAPPTSDPQSTPSPRSSKEIFDPQNIFLPRKHHDVDVLEERQRGNYPEPTFVTGSADPVSVCIYHYHPIAGKEEIVAMEVSCCNLTTWPLTDLEIQLRPIGGVGVVQCIESPKDLKMRLLRTGETVSVGTSGGSSSLAPFGAIKAEKRFCVCRFTQATFIVQAVFVHEHQSDGGDSTEGESTTPIRLAFSDRYVLHFDALLRLPQPQFSTAAFFQHCWQTANSSVLWHVNSECELDSSGEQLTICQRVLHDMNDKIAAVADLLLELPTHMHVAMLTQTRWGYYVSASLTMSVDSDTPTAANWCGVLEIRSTRENIREFERWPKDTARIFIGSNVGICNAPVVASGARDSMGPVSDAAPSSMMSPPIHTSFTESILAPMQPIAVGDRVASGKSFPQQVSNPHFAPAFRSTVFGPKTTTIDRNASFTRAQSPDQVRAPETITLPELPPMAFL